VSPNGHSITSNHASPWLATAGSGDVLAGMIAGLAAQNMHPFDACCAAVWIHGECALHFGRYLVASDLPDLIPSIMNKLLDDDLP
ncbi:MAG: NAD(P)H-hydrate dehydratase, partial [Pseudomonadota bacterium]